MHTLNVKRWTFIACTLLVLAVCITHHKEHEPAPAFHAQGALVKFAP